MRGIALLFAAGLLMVACGQESPSEKPAQSESDRTVGDRIAKAERAQNVGRLDRCRSAGRAGRDRQIGHCGHQGLALDTGEAEIEVAGQTLLFRAVENDSVEPGVDAVIQPLPEDQKPLGLRRHFLSPKPASLTEANT